MKKLWFFALILLSLNVFASRARLASLSNSFHLVDPQHLYTSLLDINQFNNLVSFESGSSTPTTGVDNAEGLLVYSLNPKTRMAFSVGHQQSLVVDARLFMNTMSGSTYQLSQNPVHLIYGIKDDMTSYAFGMYYSDSNDKFNALRESSAGFTYGLELGKLQFYGELGVLNSAQAAGGKVFDGSGALNFNVRYSLDSTSILLSYEKADLKSATLATENEHHSRQLITLALVDSRAREEDDTFWGAKVVATRIHCFTMASAVCDKEASSVKLPIWLGLEVQGSEMITLRGSISQSFLLSQSKDEVGYPAGVLSGSNGAFSEFANGANDTTVAMGLGLKFKRVLIDGTLSTATTQVLNAGNLLSQVAVTCKF